jgi:hypothetical protein
MQDVVERLTTGQPLPELLGLCPELVIGELLYFGLEGGDGLDASL